MSATMKVLDELNVTMHGFAAIEDLLCSNRDLHVVSPDNLCMLLRILRERAEADLKRLQGEPLRAAA